MTQISFKRNVLIPAGQSLILGIFVGGFAFILAKTKSPIPDIWGTGIGLLTASILYFTFSVLSYETKPKPTTRIFNDEVRISLIDDVETAYKKGTFFLLPVNRNKMIHLAKQLEAGKSFSLASFGGKGKLFTRAEFEKLRDEFINHNLAYWKNPEAHSQGINLTRGGRAFARHFSTQSIIPPPPKDYSQFKIHSPLRHRHMQTRKE